MLLHKITLVHVFASNAQGVVATDVNTITTAPLTPNTYNVITSLVSSGTYNVGAGQTLQRLLQQLQLIIQVVFQVQSYLHLLMLLIQH